MFVWVIKILQYDKINGSEGIDINKTNTSKEYDICHYQQFLNKGLHDLMQKSYEL